MDVLFERRDLQVRSALSFGSDVCFVTFDSYSDLGSLTRPGFGEAFLAAQGIDAVHILSRTNDWYLYPYAAEAFAAARAAVAGYSRVISYGSSMGGYAAIRFGRRVGAQTAIAMSPQFSINPETPPFEQRWIYDSKVIDFAIEAQFATDFVARSYIFYDPRNGDRAHVECFRGRTEVIDLPVPNGGHPVTTMLAEIGLLSGAVRGIAAGTFEPRAFIAELRANRRRSAQIFYNMANNMRRPAYALRFARTAVELRPNYPAFSANLGALLVKAGAFAEAREALDRALAIDPTDQGARYRLSEYFEAIGDLESAVAIMDTLVRDFPASRSHALRLEFILDELIVKTYRGLVEAGVEFAVVAQKG